MPCCLHLPCFLPCPEQVDPDRCHPQQEHDPSAPPLRLDIKWALRRAALALAAVMLLRSLLCYRDYERESYRWGAVRRGGAHTPIGDAWLMMPGCEQTTAATPHAG